MQFSNPDLKGRIVPLFREQLPALIWIIADTQAVSQTVEAAAPGAPLVNRGNTVFIYLFTALAPNRLSFRTSFLP